MKFIGTRSLLCIALGIASIAFCASKAHGQTLFPPTEFEVSIFGEAAEGGVDSQPEKNVVQTTQTTTTSYTVPRIIRNALVSEDPTRTTTTYGHHVYTHDRIEHSAGGGGVSFGYFFTRYMGVSLEGDFLGGDPYDTVLTANVIFRYPFEFGATTAPSGYSKDGKSTVESKTVATGPTWGIAPYIVLGGGPQWDGRCEGVGAVGAGVEFRFKQHYGIFVEGRWIAHDSRQNYAAETAGFTFSF